VSVEVIVFVIFGAAAIAGAVAMVAARNPVYSAMGLLLTMFSIAVFFVMNDAHFVAAVHILIYAGAIMTLFLFVIMLIGVDRTMDPDEPLPLQRPLGIGLSGAFLFLILVAGRTAWVTGRSDLGAGDTNGTIENISDQLFGTWMLPFLSTIFLLTIAAVGTIALAQFRAVTLVEPDHPEADVTPDAEEVTVR